MGNTVKIGYKKMYINNQMWVWRNEESLVRQTRPFRQGSDNQLVENQFYNRPRSPTNENGNDTQSTLNKENQNEQE